MCVSVETIKLDGSGDECTTASELATSLGCAVADLITRTGSVLGDDECLCDFDDEATAQKLGYVASLDPNFLDVILTQAVQQ